jgi:Family of unknown function (DUF6528)
MHRRTLLKGAAVATVAPATTLVAAEPAAAASYYVATCEQYQNKILVYPSDAGWSDSTLHWSFSPGGGTWSNLSDVKFRDTAAFGWVALVTASGGRAGIVNITSEVQQELNDVLWSYDLGTLNSNANPHSIERIPDNGSIVVADSAGYLRLFAPTAVSDPSTLALVQTISYAGAHGVLWDPTYSRLWAVGSGRATPFTVTGTYRSTRLSSTAGYVSLGTYTGSDGLTHNNLGHDLQPDYSDTTNKRLLVTHTTAVISINTETMTKAEIYPDNTVKSYVRHESGEAFWVKATGSTYHGDTRDWVSPSVQFFDASGNKSFTRSLSYGAEFYKARRWTTAFE